MTEPDRVAPDPMPQRAPVGGTQLAVAPAPALLPAPLFTPTPRAVRRFVEFFTDQINNDHTRRAYVNATRRFSLWCGDRGLAPCNVGDRSFDFQDRPPYIIHRRDSLIPISEL